MGLTALIAAMLIGFTHLVALYAAMAQIGTEGNLGYLVPRVALSLATTAVWSVFCALSLVLVPELPVFYLCLDFFEVELHFLHLPQNNHYQDKIPIPRKSYQG